MGYNERKEEGVVQDGQNLRNITIVLAVVAGLLGCALGYIWWTKSSLVNELNIEKEELTSQMIALQNDYATLSSDYDTINSQLDSSREEVSQLIERIKKTEATNRSMIRKYEKELGTLRSIMRNYIVQIEVSIIIFGLNDEDTNFKDIVNLDGDSLVAYRMVTDDNDLFTIDGLNLEDAYHLKELCSDDFQSEAKGIHQISDTHGIGSFKMFLLMIFILTVSFVGIVAFFG